MLITFNSTILMNIPKKTVTKVSKITRNLIDMLSENKVAKLN